MSALKHPDCPTCRRELTALMGQFRQGHWHFFCGNCQSPIPRYQAEALRPDEVARITRHQPGL